LAKKLDMGIERKDLEAMDEFKLKEGLVITEDYEDKEMKDEKTIAYKPLWKWLLEEKN